MHRGESLSQMAENSSATTNEMSKVIEDLSKGAVHRQKRLKKHRLHIGEMGHVIEEIVSSVDGLDDTSAKMKMPVMSLLSLSVSFPNPMTGRHRRSTVSEDRLKQRTILYR